MSIKGIVTIAAVLSFVGAGPALAKSTKHTAKAHGASADVEFVKKAAAGGLAEVEMAKVAQERAHNDQVKQFAERMVTDHSKANDELTDLAQKKGVKVPSATDRTHKQAIDKLSKLSGAAFDKAYMKHQVADHQATLALFRREAKSGRDAEIKDWAAKTLPTLEDHMKSAQQVAQAVAATATRHASMHAGARHASNRTR